MVRTNSEESFSSAFESPKKKGRGLFTSISIMVELCVKQANKLSRKMRTKRCDSPRVEPRSPIAGTKWSDSPRVEPRSPIAGTKQFLKTISNTAVTLVHKKKNDDGSGKLKREEEEEEEEWGDGGVWQRAIMMGDKCQPLEFSGVIYYDCSGKQLREAPPRSPRASPLPGYLNRANGN